MSQSQSCGKIYDLVDALQKLYDEGVHVIPGAFAIIKSKDMANILELFPDAISSDINEARIIKKKNSLTKSKKLCFPLYQVTIFTALKRLV